LREAKISHARVAAAHEGNAELIVTLTHANGGVSEVALDPLAADALMASSQRHTVAALAGVEWTHVRDALLCSWNRNT